MNGNTLKVHIGHMDDTITENSKTSNVKSFMKTLMSKKKQTKSTANTKTKGTMKSSKTNKKSIKFNKKDPKKIGTDHFQESGTNQMGDRLDKETTLLDAPIRIKVGTDEEKVGPKLNISIGGPMIGGFGAPGTPPPIDLGSPEIRIKKVAYQKPTANVPNLDVTKNIDGSSKDDPRFEGLGLKDFNVLELPVQHQKVANIVDWLQIYQDCMRFSVNTSLGVIDRIVQWNGVVVDELPALPNVPHSIEAPLKELNCTMPDSEEKCDTENNDIKSELEKVAEMEKNTEDVQHKKDSCISTMESEILNLERTRSGLWKTFEILATQLKQRFSESDDTYLLLEGLILSERALMEWHSLWAQANGARRADIRQSTQHAVHALITSVMSIIEGVKTNAGKVLQEFKTYEENSQLIAPKNASDENSSNKLPSGWENIKKLKDRYLQFLETKLCQKSDQMPISNACIMISRATRDVLKTVDPIELLPALRTGMQDLQVQLDKWALSVAPAECTIDGNQTELDEARRALVDARTLRGKLGEDLERIDKVLIQAWAITDWNQIKKVHEERKSLVDKLKEADQVLREADALVGTQMKKRIDACQKHGTTVDDGDKDNQEAVMLASEHRYNYLNELDNLTAQFHTEIYAQPKGLSDIYYRFQDIIQSETKQVLCKFRALSTQKLYEQGNYWAKLYADDAHNLHEQWRKLEHFLRNQKSTLDDAILQQKQRLVSRFDITDNEMRKLFKTVHEFEDTSFKLMEAIERKQNVLALKGLHDRLLSIDSFHQCK